MSEESSGPEPRPRPINVGAVVGGAVLGLIACWVLFAVTYVALWDAYGDRTSTTQGLLMVGSLLLVPVISLALMISPRTRQWGAGALIGIALGSVVGAGVCLPTILSGF